jgi:spindle assembly abnormal protein 6
VELLEACLSEQSKESPKFICQLVSEGPAAMLSIIETNSFKHINHLSLRFVPGDDAAVKQYLSLLVKQFKVQRI